MSSLLWDIEIELVDAACGKPWSAVQALWGLGADKRFVARLNADLGVARVTLFRDDTFQIGGPDQRLLLGVREQGGLVDVLALSSTAPDEWAWRTGYSTLLGWDLWLEAQMGLRKRLRVFATPLDWLRGAGEGVCVIEWNPASLGMLRGLGEAVTLVVDPPAKERMKSLLAHGGLPRVEAGQPQHLRGIAA